MWALGLKDGVWKPVPCWPTTKPPCWKNYWEAYAAAQAANAGNWERYRKWASFAKIK